jgi:hypothetical protein
MDYVGLGAAQWDEVLQFDSYLADDFEFTEETEVCDVHWIGGYWGGDPAEFDWGISFFYDDGTGTSPDGHPDTPSFAGPFIYAWDDCNPVEIAPGEYEMYVDLPENIPFPAGHYWIAIWGIGLYPPQSGWGYHQTYLLEPAVWGSAYFGFPFWTPGFDVQGFDFDMAFQLTTKEDAIPDLDCYGELDFVDVVPGDTVTGMIVVENIGDPGSLLDWEVQSYPVDWGTWSFNPDTGVDLPAGATVNMTVEIVAPTEEEKTFTGEIVLVNTENPDDICIVQVSLVTPLSHSVTFLELLAQRFPIFAKLLSLIF